MSVERGEGGLYVFTSPSYRSTSIQFLFREFSEVPNPLQSIEEGRENGTQCLLFGSTPLRMSTKKELKKASHVDSIFAACL